MICMGEIIEAGWAWNPIRKQYEIILRNVVTGKVLITTVKVQRENKVYELRFLR